MTFDKPVKIWIIYCLFAGLVLFRFFNLNFVPIQIDESEHLFYADSIAHNIGDLFISFKASTPYPIFIWMVSAATFIAPKTISPLILGRVCSIIADLISTYVVFLMGKNLFNKQTGTLAALIYLLLPLNFFNSRLVLLDATANMFSLITLYWVMTVMTQKMVSYKNYLLGITLILVSFFTKPTVVVPLSASFLLPFLYSVKDNSWDISFSHVVLLYKKLLIPFVIAGSIILVIFIPFYSNFTVHLNTSPDPSTSLLSIFKSNMHRSLIWADNYLTVIIFLPSLCICLFGIILRKWKIVWLGIWIFAIFFINALFSKHYYPRHIYPLSAPISLLIGWALYFIYRIKNKLSIPFIVVVFGFLFIQEYTFATNPKSVLVGEDRQEFYEDWSSGVGLDQLTSTLRTISSKQAIIVFTEDTNLTNWALTHIYSIGDTILIPDNNLILDQDLFYRSLQDSHFEKPVYIILDRYPNAPRNWHVTLVRSFKRSNTNAINLYEYLGN